MAYRSNVYILASKGIAEKIFKVLNTTAKESQPFDNIKVSPTGETYFFEAIWHTWDENSDGVAKNIMQALTSENENTELPYEYIRAGEARDDIDRMSIGLVEEGEIYDDGHAEFMDTWDDVEVDENGYHTVKVSNLEKFRPFWDELAKKAESFGLKVVVSLEDAVKDAE
jgi:hypothetical protein